MTDAKVGSPEWMRARYKAQQEERTEWMRARYKAQQEWMRARYKAQQEERRAAILASNDNPDCDPPYGLHSRDRVLEAITRNLSAAANAMDRARWTTAWHSLAWAQSDIRGANRDFHDSAETLEPDLALLQERWAGLSERFNEESPLVFPKVEE